MDDLKEENPNIEQHYKGWRQSGDEPTTWDKFRAWLRDPLHRAPDPGPDEPEDFHTAYPVEETPPVEVGAQTGNVGPGTTIAPTGGMTTGTSGLGPEASAAIPDPQIGHEQAIPDATFDEVDPTADDIKDVKEYNKATMARVDDEEKKDTK